MTYIQVINGPNLNLLGQREPALYGHQTLENIELSLKNEFLHKNLSWNWFQSNHEGELVDKIQSLINQKCDALIINPAAYSHSSIAILDALKILQCPIVEVHLSNVFGREEFRRQLITAQAATTVISGGGPEVYCLAVQWILKSLQINK
jgi:3-dehydroquinate dehydratase-2